MSEDEIDYRLSLENTCKRNSAKICATESNECTWRRGTKPTARVPRRASCVAKSGKASVAITQEEYDRYTSTPSLLKKGKPFKNTLRGQDIEDVSVRTASTRLRSRFSDDEKQDRLGEFLSTLQNRRLEEKNICEELSLDERKELYSRLSKLPGGEDEKYDSPKFCSNIIKSLMLAEFDVDYGVIDDCLNQDETEREIGTRMAAFDFQRKLKPSWYTEKNPRHLCEAHRLIFLEEGREEEIPDILEKDTSEEVRAWWKTFPKRPH